MVGPIIITQKEAEERGANRPCQTYKTTSSIVVEVPDHLEYGCVNPGTIGEASAYKYPVLSKEEADKQLENNNDE